jgi:hypothetical protein
LQGYGITPKLHDLAIVGARHHFQVARIDAECTV